MNAEEYMPDEELALRNALIEKSGKLNKNIKNVPKTDLLGKYYKSFHALFNECINMAGQYSCIRVREFLYIGPDEQGKALLTASHQLVSDHAQEIANIVVKGDIDSLDTLLYQLRAEFFITYWYPYVQEKQRL